LSADCPPGVVRVTPPSVHLDANHAVNADPPHATRTVNSRTGMRRTVIGNPPMRMFKAGACACFSSVRSLVYGFVTAQPSDAS
jgi:hypothetical protein